MSEENNTLDITGENKIIEEPKNEEKLTVKKTILVVEDEFHIREIIKLTFEMRGYVVLEASNGKEALKIVAGKKPDVIVTDIMMPEMGGLEFFLTLREKSETCDIPVIVLTVKNSLEDAKSASLLGIDEFITKPFDPRDLVNKIEGILNRQ